MSDPWTTAITSIQPNEVRVRGYDIADLMKATVRVGGLPHPSARRTAGGRGRAA
ncbi:MAG: hypothetical protein R3B49_05245 [Phycisphaerales bacterium]